MQRAAIMDTSLARRKLLARRSALISRFRNGLERADEELAQHPAEPVDRATDQHDTEELAALGDSEILALGEVVSALVRIEAGSYGTCTMCQEPIPARRLEVIPEAATCVSCATIKARRHA
jgi:RNA polymerase-binding transcription factor DksA